MDNEILMLSLQTREPYETLRERLEKDRGLERFRSRCGGEDGHALYEKLAS